MTRDARRPQAEPADAGSVLTQALLRTGTLLGLSNAAVARAVGVSESQISRMAAGQRRLEVGTKPAELAALVIRVYRSLDALVGNSDRQRLLWMNSFNQAFNEAPREAVQRAEGLVRVVRYLDGARALA